jgi:hypothetical protein
MATAPLYEPPPSRRLPRLPTLGPDHGINGGAILADLAVRGAGPRAATETSQADNAGSIPVTRSSGDPQVSGSVAQQAHPQTDVRAIAVVAERLRSAPTVPRPSRLQRPDATGIAGQNLVVLDGSHQRGAAARRRARRQRSGSAFGGPAQRAPGNTGRCC